MLDRLTIRPHFGVDHVLLHGRRHQERAAQVHVHDRVPVGLGHLEQQVVAGDAGVVDQHGRRAELGGDPRRRRPRPASASLTSAPTASARPPGGLDRLDGALGRRPRPGRARRRRTRPAASRRAVAAPMPRAAPVTMATRAVVASVMDVPLVRRVRLPSPATGRELRPPGYGRVATPRHKVGRSGPDGGDDDRRDRQLDGGADQAGRVEGRLHQVVSPSRPGMSTSRATKATACSTTPRTPKTTV